MCARGTARARELRLYVQRVNYRQRRSPRWSREAMMEADTLQAIEQAQGSCPADDSADGDADLVKVQVFEERVSPGFNTCSANDWAAIGHADGLGVPMEFMELAEVECGNEELALTPPAEPTSASVPYARDKTGVAGTSAGTPDVESGSRNPDPHHDPHHDPRSGSSQDPHVRGSQWRPLMQLLRDNTFQPGVRPDVILGETTTPGLMYKEQPKRRRRHSMVSHPRDKWYNTGGIKSASDRFDSASNCGLRKRYGKIVRQGLPVIRFHEYKLLEQDPATGKLREGKDGPTLFHLLAEKKPCGKRRPGCAGEASADGAAKGGEVRSGGSKRRRCSKTFAQAPYECKKIEAQVESHEVQLQAMRTREADLRKQLAAAKAKIAEQAAELRTLRQSQRSQ